MKIARKEHPAIWRLKKMSHSLIICGVVCTMGWWAYFVFVASSVLNSATTSTLPGDSINTANGHLGRNKIEVYVANVQNREQLSTAHSKLGTSIDIVTHGANNHSSDKQSQFTQDKDAYRNQTAPLSSLIYPLHAKAGTYHAFMYIGTPPQRQTLIVDTGSRLTAFPCHPHCPSCGQHTNNPFYLNASSSYKVVSCGECKLLQADFPIEDYFAGDEIGGNSGDGPPLRLRRSNKHGTVEMQERQRRLFPNSCINDRCEVNQRYTEGSSWRAFEVEDKVWLGLNETVLSADDHRKFSSPFVFGCQISEEGLFKSQYADGIMGLSMYTQTLVDRLVQSGSISHQSFSLCLNSRGGHIALGGTALTHNQEGRQTRGMHLSPMQFTPFAKENVWYYTVTVTSISVGLHILPKGILQFVNDHKGTIVDSGTTDTFISHKVAKVSKF